MTVQRVMELGACLLLSGVLAACTGGSAGKPAPTATAGAPRMTSVLESGGHTVTVRADLRRPEPAKGDVSRIDVRNADGLFWSGGLDTIDLTRAGRTYRLFGRCLPATTGGTLVVDVLGPEEGAGARPSTGTSGPGVSGPGVSGPAVATITLPCDGKEVSRTLTALPASSGPLSVNEATRQVEQGWVVLTRTA